MSRPDLHLPVVPRRELERCRRALVLEQAEALKRLRAWDGIAALLAQEQARSTALREQLERAEGIERGLRVLIADQEQVLAQRNRVVSALHEELRARGGMRRLHLAEPLHIADVLQDWQQEMLGRADEDGAS